MDLITNIPFLIFLVGIALLFSWQWRKTRKLNKQFMGQPDELRKKEESKLYLDPIRDIYVRSQPKWFMFLLIAMVVIMFVLIGLQKTGIIK